MKRLLKGSIKNLLALMLGVTALIVLIHYSGMSKYIALEYLQQQGDSFKAAAQNHYLLAIIIYLTVYIVLIALGPVVIPLTLMGGFLFGLIPGFLLSLFAATFGSVLAMIAIRHLVASMLRKRYQKQLEEFGEKMEENGASYLLTLQLLSIIPYFITDTLAALSNVSIRDFTWTFALGNTPLIFILSYTGQRLASIHSFGEILTPQILGGLAVLAILASLPAILKRFNIKI